MATALAFHCLLTRAAVLSRSRGLQHWKVLMMMSFGRLGKVLPLEAAWLSLAEPTCVSALGARLRCSSCSDRTGSTS